MNEELSKQERGHHMLTRGARLERQARLAMGNAKIKLEQAKLLKARGQELINEYEQETKRTLFKVVK